MHTCIAMHNSFAQHFINQGPEYTDTKNVRIAPFQITLPMELISWAPDSILHKSVHKFVFFPVGTEYTQ